MPPMRFYWWVQIRLEFDFKRKRFCVIMGINRWQKRWYRWKRPQANWWIFCAASQMQQPLFRRTLTSCRIKLLWSSIVVTVMAKNCSWLRCCPCFIRGAVTVKTVRTNMVIINVCKFFYFFGRVLLLFRTRINLCTHFSRCWNSAPSVHCHMDILLCSCSVSHVLIHRIRYMLWTYIADLGRSIIVQL